MILDLFRARQQIGKVHRHNIGLKGRTQWHEPALIFYKVKYYQSVMILIADKFRPIAPGMEALIFRICVRRVGEFSCFDDG